MSEQHFEKMDQEWMKSTKDLREKKVSDGILKGFSASVERRILSQEQAPKRSALRAWVPAMAVLVIASVVVFRSPILSTPFAPVLKTTDYAQLDDNEEMDVEEEIAALTELDAWSEEDDAENLELSVESSEGGDLA